MESGAFRVQERVAESRRREEEKSEDIESASKAQEARGRKERRGRERGVFETHEGFQRARILLGG